MIDWALWAISLYTSLWTALMIHELGHYAVSRWYVFPISRFSAGTGASARFYYRGTLFEFGIVPFTGFVRFSFKSTKWWKNALVAAGGPAANYVAAGAIYLISPTDPLISLHVLFGTINLFPFKGHDGRLILGEISSGIRAAWGAK